MIGIYKITNPIGQVYIGQSKNIERRFLSYTSLNSGCPKIYNSFIKYGFQNHTFEIIFECCIDNIKLYEAYFIDKYNSFNNGLNSYSLNKNLPKEKIYPIEKSIILKAKYKSIGKIIIEKINSTDLSTAYNQKH